MSRTPIAFHTTNISGLARSLRRELQKFDTVPGHVEILNILARAAGKRNFQHLKAEAENQPAPQSPRQPDIRLPDRHLNRLKGCFDGDGVLTRWPARRTDQIVMLWILWSRIPARTELSEKQVNEYLVLWHSFGDHALLRRELCDLGLMNRTPDGRIYHRVEKQMPTEALQLRKALHTTTEL